METLFGARKPNQPTHETVTREPDTIVRHLVARATVARETREFAIWNHYDEQTAPKEGKISQSRSGVNDKR
jgi:hypothetical protein